jgi:hypothetical protein
MLGQPATELVQRQSGIRLSDVLQSRIRLLLDLRGRYGANEKTH